MSASTDENVSALHLAAAPWRPAGMLYLATMLLALAAGLWPQAIYPPRQGPTAAPLPALATLAASQAAFTLLAYPLVLLHRASGPRRRRDGYWGRTIAESAFLIFASVPLYVLAAFFSDATAPDAVRAGLCAASCFPLAWAAGAHFTSRRDGQWGVLLALMLVAVALPAAFYVALEFFPPGSAGALGDLSPILLAWRNGTSRLGAVFPTPLWGWLIWPVLAGVALLSAMILPLRPGPARPQRGSGREAD